MKKILLLFLSLTMFSQCVLDEDISYKDFFRNHVKLPQLKLKLKPKENKLTPVELSYITRDYGSVVVKDFSSNWSAKDQYLYLRALMHLKNWDQLYSIIQNQNIHYADAVLGPYLLEIVMNTAFYKDDSSLMDLSYHQFKTVESLNPINTDKKYAIQDLYAAGMDNIQLAHSRGGYYYYVYQKNKSLQDLLMAVRQKYAEAIGSITLKDFQKNIPKSQWNSYLNVAKANNSKLYIGLLASLKKYDVLSSYYFQRGKYQSALRYAPKGSFTYHASLLMQGKEGRAKPSIDYAYKNLNKMFFYLSFYFFKQEDYASISKIFRTSYAPKSLRHLVVLGLNEAQYRDLYEILVEIKYKSPKNMNLHDKGMMLYWLGFLANKLGLVEDSILYYQEAATHYPGIYYGWESFKAMPASAYPNVLKGWNNIYKENESRLKSYIDTVNNVPLDKDNIYLNRAFFFFKIREDARAKISLRMFTQNTKNENYLYPLATLFYANHRMDYFYFYMRSFWGVLEKYVGYKIFFDDLLPYLFPRKHSQAIKAATEKYNISANLLESLILQESTYDYLALSWVGAQGLTQLMPYTGDPIIKKLYKNKVIKNMDVWDPETNIFAGADYLDWLMHKVYKDYPKEDQLALSYASYNAGPRRIKKMYTRMKNRVNIPHYIESIDFAESRDYAQKLIYNKDIYSFLYHS